MSVTDEHWLGLESAQAKGPTSRKQREKWGTLRAPKNLQIGCRFLASPFDY